MTPERWQQIDQIFAEALDRAPDERGAFLDTTCGSDAELRREVDSLLAHDQPETLVGTTVDATKLFNSNPRGREIGPYRIVRTLGAGGMGQVFLAQDSRLNRYVAVKMISQYTAAEEERVRRFRQEAFAASALNHPNILTIYEIGEVDGNNFIATEFVDGRTLGELIGEGTLTVEKSIDIAKQVATALSAAHEAGIVHRDIKPPNIMIRSDGLVKILDFGVAKFSSPNTDLRKDSAIETMPGTVVGTAAYMSPEQARGNPIDNRTDIWSLGIILFEMIAGHRPFEGETPLDVMSAVIERRPQLLSESGIVAPQLLEDIISKALKKDREERYQSAVEMLGDLQEFTGQLEHSSASHRVSTFQTSEPTSSETSIAVLPFVNISAEPDNEYFCDGLSEELLNALTKIQDLKVAARTSAFSFKGKDITASGIGRALNVNTVLEGSVRKSGNRLRISVQLINCADGYHLWSERYDRQMEDIFDVQDEIALAIVDALKVKLLGKEKDAILKRYTDNVEAYQLYLKGRYYWWKTAPEEFGKSKDFFERAVQADPTYALSYAGISSYFGFGAAWGMVPPEIGWPKAWEANDKCLALDNTLPEVHANTAGIVMVRNRNFVFAERSIKRSIELNPNFQEAHFIYSFHLAVRSKFEESIREAQKALELDPFSVRLNQHLGMTYYLARKFDDAITQFKLAIELDPGNPHLQESLGDAYEQRLMFDDAIAAWLTAINLSGNSAGADELRELYATSGFDSVLRAISLARLKELTKKQQLGEYVPAIYSARAHTRLGNTEDALEWLSKAFDERNVFPLMVRADPFYDGLRSDQRFMDMLHRFDQTVELSKV